MMAGVMNNLPAGNVMLPIFSFPPDAGLLPLLKRGVDIPGGGPPVVLFSPEMTAI
ncbi:hypothetical protein [Methanosphaerula palustris]|uniref:Uncharacterized protein n=1 Tax=Methanosphaerula palustris (strain ATCC BAA-1556 / DSM 19958 / E1-9c) TaxID=521011 RepID=B8GH39_METPE|nr:hypothetical protein [Methanosphaerula palustris]ACL16444.1 hypothetical protein Mpal_1098 [Methanosphaerula palustris E1-9c]